MRYGIFMMPMHPARPPAVTDFAGGQGVHHLADKLGFYDAFVGEHLTEKSENVTNSFIFLATLISDTKQIKLGTGTSISQMHPVLITSHAAMFDHLAKGRFIFGISPGILKSDAEALGNLEADKNKLFAEAIDVILAIWERDPPYDIDFPDNRFKVTTRTMGKPDIYRGHLYKPYQKPHPEIVGTVVAPFSKGVILMGKRDFHPLSANFLLSKWLPSHWQNYAQGKRNVGQIADPADWRIARTIFVADDDKTAQRYGHDDPKSPYRYYWHMMRTKMFYSGRIGVFKSHKEQDDKEITEDYVLDRLVMSGTVNKVVDQILALREEIGDFGELVYAGMDWVDPALAKRSMELFANEVMPRVNQALSVFQTCAGGGQIALAATVRRRFIASSTFQRAWSCRHRIAPLLALIGLLGQFDASAQNYPAKPVRYLIGASTGSGGDTLARLVTAGLSQNFGQQVVVENRPGAAGNIVAELAAKSAPDGYALFQVTIAYAVYASLYRNLSYDLIRDFAPVTQLATGPYVVVVHPSLPVKSIGELIRLAKAKPGVIDYSSAGAGTPTFLAAELFKAQAGVDMMHIPYKGGVRH